MLSTLNLPPSLSLAMAPQRNRWTATAEGLIIAVLFVPRWQSGLSRCALSQHVKQMDANDPILFETNPRWQSTYCTYLIVLHTYVCTRISLYPEGIRSHRGKSNNLVCHFLSLGLAFLLLQVRVVIFQNMCFVLFVMISTLNVYTKNFRHTCVYMHAPKDRLIHWRIHWLVVSLIDCRSQLGSTNVQLVARDTAGCWTACWQGVSEWMALTTRNTNRSGIFDIRFPQIA